MSPNLGFNLIEISEKLDHILVTLTLSEGHSEHFDSQLSTQNTQPNLWVNSDQI